jgi:hypothetical protein
MNTDNIAHYGNSSWWDGTFTTLCGITIPSGQSRSAPLFPTKCTTCKRLKKENH